MALIQWSKALEVNEPAIDQDHQSFVARVNAAYDAMTGPDRDGDFFLEQMKDVVRELLAYAQAHFTREEVLLVQTSYPDLARHKALHADIIEQVERFIADMDESESFAASGFFFLLRDWFIEHIVNVDQGYAPYLAELRRPSGRGVTT